MASKPRTLYEKIWDAHVVSRRDDGTCLIYIDRHLVHEVTSPQAFEALRVSGRKVRRPDLTLAVPDHNLPTTARLDAAGQRLPIADAESAQQLAALEKNAPEFGIRYIDAIPTSRAGHRPRRRPRAGLSRCPARPSSAVTATRACHGGRWRAGVRHRHQRGRACAGHANAAGSSNRRRWKCALMAKLGAGRHPEGPDPAHHRRDRHGGRHRPCHRIRGYVFEAMSDRRPADGVQHERSRAARAPASSRPMTRPSPI